MKMNKSSIILTGNFRFILFVFMYITDCMYFMVKSLQNVPLLLNGYIFLVILNFL